MPSKKSNSPSSRAVVIVMLTALLGVGVFAAYVNMTPGASRVADDMRRSEQVVAPNPSVSVQGQPTNAQIGLQTELLVPVVSGEEIVLQKRLGPVPQGHDPRLFLLTETLKELGIQNGQAIGIEVDNGVASIDVSREVAEHGFGSMEEGQFLKAIQLALGQFPEVQKFELRYESQKMESLGGHFDLTDPLEVVRTEKSAGSKLAGD